MSESEGKKELSGIARSIDALFSPDTDAEPGSEIPPGPPKVEGEALAGTPASSDTPEPPLAASELAASESETAPGPGGLETDAPPPLPAADPSPAPPGTEGGPPPLPGADDGPSPLPRGEAVPPPLPEGEGDVGGTGSHPTEPAPATPSRGEDVGSSAPPPPDVEGDDDEFVPTRLDLAVDAYLDGDAGKAAEIQSIAEEMLEGREIDPVARAVGRLATAAGEPPDRTVLELARSIATDFVYNRLAAHIGAEHDEDRRRECFVACRNLGEPIGMAIRDHLAESTDRHARRIHCEALVEMGDAGRKIIEAMVDDENRFLVRNAVAILGDTGGDRAVELVTSALANPDARVRKEALRSLAKLGDEESGELVLGLLEDSDPEVRIAAAVAAGELNVQRALRFVVKMLDDTSDPDEAIPLIRALGHLGDPGAVPSIEKHAVPRLFSRPRTDVRIVAYRALNEFGTPHARRLLNQAVSDKDPEVKAAVKDILGMR